MSELRTLRAALPAIFFAAALVLLAVANLAGLTGRAPVVAAGLGLTVAVGHAAVRAALRLAGRFLWRIRRKLILSYILIAFVPLLLATVLFALIGYIALGQLMAYLASQQLGALHSEVNAACHALSERLRAFTAAASEPAALRGAPDPGDELRALKVRFPGAAASAVVVAPGQVSFVPAGLEWEPGSRAARPAWMQWPHFDAAFVLRSLADPAGAAGRTRETLEIRSAETLGVGPYQVYVEVGVPLDDGTLEVLRESLAMDLRVVEARAAGGRLQSLAAARRPEGGRGLLARLPLVGAFFIHPLRWASGERSSEGRLLVAQRSIRGLWRDLSGFGLENRVLILSVLVLVGGGFLVVEASSLLVGISLARSITGSIHDLSEGTRRIESRDLEHRIPVASDDQLGDLARAFNRMASSIGEFVRASAERERLEEELRIGRRIQQSLLPRSGFRDPRFEIAALSLPAREVGGDYWDWFELGSDRIGLLVADVSGKGTEAAFYMAEVKGIMLALSRIHERPAEVLAEANALLSQSLDRRTFVTMTYAVLDRARSTLRFGRAGHSPVLLLARDGVAVEALRPAGLALGLDRDGRFHDLLEERSVGLGPGDIVLLYTDGVTDTLGRDGGLYGEARLQRALVAARGRDAEGIRDTLVAELRRFAAPGPPHDDLTIIVLRAI